MIIEAEIIPLPYSGEFHERLYDFEYVWNSQNWTFVKFTNDDYSEWCGQFRGAPRQVSISAPKNMVLVLTSDYLFQLDRKTGDVTELMDQPLYNYLTTSPNGDFILAENYNLVKVTTNIKESEYIESSFQMDMIEFKKWDNSRLEFTCYEFINWEKHLTMTYDSETNKIEIKDVIQSGN